MSGFSVHSIDVYCEAIFLGGVIAKDVRVYTDDKTGERYLNAITLAQLIGRTSGTHESKFMQPWPKHFKASKAPRSVVKVENIISFWNDIRPSDAHLSEQRFAILFPDDEHPHPIRKRKPQHEEKEEECDPLLKEQLRLLEEDRKRIAQEFMASLEAKRPQFEEELKRQILAEHKRKDFLRQVQKLSSESVSSLSDLQQFIKK